MFARDPRQPRTRLFGMYSPAPEWRFPKTFLDRLDVLTIDGRVLDAASWNVKRLIWRPDVRLERTGGGFRSPPRELLCRAWLVARAS